MKQINEGDDLEKTGMVLRCPICLCSENLFHSALFLVTSISLLCPPLLWPSSVRTDKSLFFPTKGFLGDCTFFFFALFFFLLAVTDGCVLAPYWLY